MGNMKGRGVVAALVAGMVVAGTALAGLRLAPVFSDNLVLQRDARVKIWGLAAPDEKVTVTFADSTEMVLDTTVVSSEHEDFAEAYNA